MKEMDRDMIKDYLRSRIEPGIASPERAALELIEELDKPVEMLLFCPRCDAQHIDPPMDAHSTHLCHYCHLTWRPSNRRTVGVRSIPANKDHHFQRIQAANPRSHSPHRPRHRGKRGAGPSGSPEAQ